VALIRIPEEQWGEIWRVLIQVGPITCVDKDLTYVVSPAHLDLLKDLGLPFETVEKPLTKEQIRLATLAAV
jgi:hypothetical protein